MSQETNPPDSTKKSLFTSVPTSANTTSLFGGGGGGGPKTNPAPTGSLFGSNPTFSLNKGDDSKPKSLGLGAAFNTPALGLFAGGAKPSDDKKTEGGVIGNKFSGNPATSIGLGPDAKKALPEEEKKPTGAFTFTPAAGGLAGIKRANSGIAAEENQPDAAVVGDKLSGNPTATGTGFGPDAKKSLTETKGEEKKSGFTFGPSAGGSLSSSGVGGNKPTTEEKKPEAGVLGNKFSGNPTATGLGFGSDAKKPLTETKSEEKPLAGGLKLTPSVGGSSGGGLFGGGALGAGGIKPLNTGTTTEVKKPETKSLNFGAGGAAPGLNLGGNKPPGASAGPTVGGGFTLSGVKMATSHVGGMFDVQTKTGDAGDVSVDGVLDKWNRDLNNKAEEFKLLTKNIVEYEKQIVVNLEVEQELVKELEKMENEYKAVEFSLEGIMKGQDQLTERVEELESGLSKYQYPDGGQKVNKEKMSRDDLIKLAEGMNKEIEGMDSDILKLIEEMSKSAEQKDSSQLTENVLGNYLKTLQFIEAETLKAMTQMNKIENHLANQ